MGFGSAFSSPANSPTTIKGKLFSRLTSGGYSLPSSPGPTSANSSTASSPTSLYSSSSCSLTSLPGSLGQIQGAVSKRKTPTVLKLAAASQKLSLTKSISPEQQKDSFSSSIIRQYQAAAVDSSPRDQSSYSSTSSGRSSRSPTSLLPPPSAMGTIFEEDGLQGGSLRKDSIGNRGDSRGNDTTCHLSQRSSTFFAPRSSAQSENGNNALSGEGDCGRRIVDNDTNFEESVTNFNHLHSSIEEEGASMCTRTSPVRVPRRSRRGATLSIDAVEDLAAATDSTSSLQGDRNDFRTKTSSNSNLSFHASSPLSYSRSKTLPVSQSIHNLKSMKTAREMKSRGRRTLSRTASEPGLDCIAEGEVKDEEIEDRESVSKLTRSNETLSSGGDESKGSGLGKRPKVQNKFPAHIQKLLTDHLLKKLATVRTQSPLVRHRVRSPDPQRSQSLRRNNSRRSAAAPIDPPIARDTEDATSKREQYSRSISEPVAEDKSSSQLRDSIGKTSISSRITAIIPERENLSVSRLVTAAYEENI